MQSTCELADDSATKQWASSKAEPLPKPAPVTPASLTGGLVAGV